MLNPDDRWVWDFWHVPHNGLHHVYYLQAPKALGDPELRHRHATIGHATSSDLREWTEHGTVLSPGPRGADDATATWTGSVVRGEDGTWWMFYTGSVFLSTDDNRNLETILAATSTDLYHWAKVRNWSLHADPTWYERLGDSSWPEEAWRDPSVYKDKNRWTMMLTGRSRSGPVDDRGVVGLATSDDLVTWKVQPPLTAAGNGFAQLEILQRTMIGGRDYLIFSTQNSTLSEQRRRAGGDTGTWIAPIGDEVHLDHAVNLIGPRLYGGRIIKLDGTPRLLAFNLHPDGSFLGGITDPLELAVLEGVPTLRSESR